MRESNSNYTHFLEDIPVSKWVLLIKAGEPITPQENNTGNVLYSTVRYTVLVVIKQNELVLGGYPDIQDIIQTERLVEKVTWITVQ